MTVLVNEREQVLPRTVEESEPTDGLCATPANLTAVVEVQALMAAIFIQLKVSEQKRYTLLQVKD